MISWTQKTIPDYCGYHAARHSQEKQQRLARPRPTPDQLWNEVLNLDVFGPYTEGNEIRELLDCGAFDLVPLGKAIAYPDGHPFEDEIRLGILEDVENKLRRFVSLGWIVEGDEEVWHKTGHALVVELEPGGEHNPWIVLAYEWPNDGEETCDDDYMEYAPQVVERDDEWTVGVLPGDWNRTIVGKIVPFEDENIKGSILPHFWRDFKFNILRKGSSRGYIVGSERGPGLANVMGWYWDPEAEEEVCNTKEGEEYTRFSREMAKISYCKRGRESFAGDEGASS